MSHYMSITGTLKFDNLESYNKNFELLSSGGWVGSAKEINEVEGNPKIVQELMADYDYSEEELKDIYFMLDDGGGFGECHIIKDEHNLEIEMPSFTSNNIHRWLDIVVKEAVEVMINTSSVDGGAYLSSIYRSNDILIKETLESGKLYDYLKISDSLKEYKNEDGGYELDEEAMDIIQDALEEAEMCGDNLAYKEYQKRESSTK